MYKLSVRFLAFVIAASCALAQRAPDVRFEPTPPKVLKQMLALAELKNGDVVYDLGCGDGRVVIAALKKGRNIRGVGVDVNAELLKAGEESARREKVDKRMQFRNGDLFTADIHDATVVMLFLSPEVNLRLRPKLWRELKPGTRIISHCHNMGDWKPEKQVEVGEHTVYLWRVPAK